MKLGRLILSCFALSLLVLWQSCAESQLAQEYPYSLSVDVREVANQPLPDEAVSLSVNRLREGAPDFNPRAFVVLESEADVPSQADDLDGDGTPDQITLVADFTAGESKSLTIRYAANGEKQRTYTKRTQAELSQKFGGRWENRKYLEGWFQNVDFVRVPEEHTDHSSFFRYEGPGWESDKVGYRFYLDWRNATDIFGKKTTAMVLQNVGQDGFDSYHEMSDWGMDVLQVGKSLGVGSIGMWHDGKVFRVSETDSITCGILANGPVLSQIETQYFGWQVGEGKYDLTSNLSITAGSRLTKHEIDISGDPANLCTGLVKHEQAELLRSESNAAWSYLGLYGKQSLAEDKLGMAVLYRQGNFDQLVEDEFSHVVVLKPNQGSVTYYFVAAWEKEPDGIKTKEQFQAYLEDTLTRLNKPVEIDWGQPKS